VCKEILRWHPVTPLGTFPWYLYDIERQHTIMLLLEAVPHATTKDDVHAGFFIPKGEPCFLKESAWCFPTCVFQAWWWSEMHGGL
jgi:hypothetical protein